MNQKNSPLVSMVMGAYNGEKYIEGALCSALEQEYPNMEFVVVDDGSTDKTRKILNTIADKDERIRLFQNEVNQGIAKTLNTCLANASGKYIANLDQDDYWIDKYKTQKQVSFLQSHPEVGFLGTNAIVQENFEDRIVLHKFKHTADNQTIKNQIIEANPFHHSSVMYRNMYRDIGGYPETNNYSADYAYRLKAGVHTQFANLPDYTLLYNSHDNNASNKYRWSQMAESISLSWQYRKDYPNKLRCLRRKGSRLLYAALLNLTKEMSPWVHNQKNKIIGGKDNVTLDSEENVFDYIHLLQVE